MIKPYQTQTVGNNSKEIKTFAIVLSVLLHLIIIFYPIPKIETRGVTLRNVGVTNGAKSAHIMVLRKSEIHGQDINLGNIAPVGSLKGQNSKSQDTLSKISLSTQNSKTLEKKPTIKKMIVQKIEGKDVNIPQGLNFSQKSREAFDGSMFDLNIILPEGIKEDQLNRFEEMFYSFRKRVAEQYINQILLLSATTGNRYPRTSFPWTNKTQMLRAKLTFDSKGNLQRVEHLQKSDSKILQEYFQDVMNTMERIPNPPRDIINQEENFELVFGLNIVD